MSDSSDVTRSTFPSNIVVRLRAGRGRRQCLFCSCADYAKEKRGMGVTIS